MNNNRSTAVFAVAILIYCAAFAQMSGDNTKINKRDTDVHQMTADQQTFKETDTNITAHIRKNLMDEKELSTYAHNVKIITMNGKVTLKGPVRSKAEKIKIAKYADEIVGAENVTNQISVVPEKK